MWPVNQLTSPNLSSSSTSTSTSSKANLSNLTLTTLSHPSTPLQRTEALPLMTLDGKYDHTKDSRSSITSSMEDDDDEEKEDFIQEDEKRRICNKRCFCLKKCSNLSNKSQFWLSLIATIFLTASLCFYFSCPSTLFIYLIWIFLIFPLDLFFLIKSFIKSRLYSAKTTTDENHLYQTLPIHINDNDDIQYSSSTSSSKRSNSLNRFRFTFLIFGSLIWSWALLFNNESNLMLQKMKSTNTVIPASTTSSNNNIGKTFIAINLYNSASLFPKYGTNLIELAKLIGGSEEDVFISIFESNSKDKTQEDLDLLSWQFNNHSIRHSIVSGDGGQEHSSKQQIVSDVKHVLTKSDHIGIDGDGHSRIAFLANVRNEALKPFHESNTTFDKVLWLNDVVFDPMEIKQLLETNNGLYDATCGFDFMPLGLYDTWVTRDIDGKRAKPLWPFFNANRDVQTLLENKPILVDSCWNGAVAFDARWFRETSVPLIRPGNANSSQSTITNKVRLPRADETQVSLPLRFRDSSACLSSECLLISLDIHHALQKANKRPVILMNPNVITAYDQKTFFMFHDLMRWKIVQPWRLVWERFISAFVFRRLTDIGRKPSQCFEAFHTFWSKPHPLSQTAKTNSDILEDVVKNRWQ